MNTGNIVGERNAYGRQGHNAHGRQSRANSLLLERPKVSPRRADLSTVPSTKRTRVGETSIHKNSLSRSRGQSQSELRSAPRAPFVMLVLVLVVAGMVGLVLLNTAINENAFRLHELTKVQKEHNLREQQLQRDLSNMESAGALTAAARRQGLVDAGTPAFIELPSGEVLGKPTPAGR